MYVCVRVYLSLSLSIESLSSLSLSISLHPSLSLSLKAVCSPPSRRTGLMPLCGFLARAGGGLPPGMSARIRKYLQSSAEIWAWFHSVPIGSIPVSTPYVDELF